MPKTDNKLIKPVNIWMQKNYNYLIATILFCIWNLSLGHGADVLF